MPSGGPILWACAQSHVGLVRVVATPTAILDVTIGDVDEGSRDGFRAFWPEIAADRFQGAVSDCATAIAALVARDVIDERLPLPIAWQGTPFQVRVWSQLLSVRRGTVTT